MKVIILYSAGRPQDNRRECEREREMPFIETTIPEALSLFGIYCIDNYPQGSQIVISSIKTEI
jgi:hypothetical protein